MGDYGGNVSFQSGRVSRCSDLLPGRRLPFKPMFRLEWPPMVIQINGSNGSQARAASAAI